MGQYSIWVLEYSWVMKFAKSAVLYAAHNQGTLKLPYCYTLIRGNGHNVLFDVGHMNKGFGKEFVIEASNATASFAGYLTGH